MMAYCYFPQELFARTFSPISDEYRCHHPHTKKGRKKGRKKKKRKKETPLLTMKIKYLISQHGDVKASERGGTHNTEHC